MRIDICSSDESGWAWFIPLHTGVTSVGVVVNKEIYARRARSQSENVVGSTPLEGPDCEKVESAHATLFQTLGAYLGFSTPRPVPSNVSPSTQRYLETLEFAPGLKKLLGEGKLANHLGSNGDGRSLVHTASDYSYSADKYAGNGWRVIGDAGGKQWGNVVLLFR